MGSRRLAFEQDGGPSSNSNVKIRGVGFNGNSTSSSAAHQMAVGTSSIGAAFPRPVTAPSRGSRGSSPSPAWAKLYNTPTAASQAKMVPRRSSSASSRRPSSASSNRSRSRRRGSPSPAPREVTRETYGRRPSSAGPQGSSSASRASSPPSSATTRSGGTSLSASLRAGNRGPTGPPRTAWGAASPPRGSGRSSGYGSGSYRPRSASQKRAPPSSSSSSSSSGGHSGSSASNKSRRPRARGVTPPPPGGLRATSRSMLQAASAAALSAGHSSVIVTGAVGSSNASHRRPTSASSRRSRGNSPAARASSPPSSSSHRQHHTNNHHNNTHNSSSHSTRHGPVLSTSSSLLSNTTSSSASKAADASKPSTSSSSSTAHSNKGSALSGIGSAGSWFNAAFRPQPAAAAAAAAAAAGPGKAGSAPASASSAPAVRVSGSNGTQVAIPVLPLKTMGSGPASSQSSAATGGSANVGSAGKKDSDIPVAAQTQAPPPGVVIPKLSLSNLGSSKSGSSSKPLVAKHPAPSSSSIPSSSSSNALSPPSVSPPAVSPPTVSPPAHASSFSNQSPPVDNVYKPSSGVHADTSQYGRSKLSQNSPTAASPPPPPEVKTAFEEPAPQPAKPSPPAAQLLPEVTPAPVAPQPSEINPSPGYSVSKYSTSTSSLTSISEVDEALGQDGAEGQIMGPDDSDFDSNPSDDEDDESTEAEEDDGPTSSVLAALENAPFVPRAALVSQVMAVKIKDGLFVGNAAASQFPLLLTTHKITHVINVAASNLPNIFEQYGVKYLPFYWAESEASLVFDSKDLVVNKIVAFIDAAAAAGEGVLVHSVHGESRAVAVVIAYMMKRYAWGFDQALEAVAARHPDMALKAVYVRQLRNFEVRLRASGGIGSPALAGEAQRRSEEELMRHTFVNSTTYLDEAALREVGTKLGAGPTRLKWRASRTAVELTAPAGSGPRHRDLSWDPEAKAVIDKRGGAGRGLSHSASAPSILQTTVHTSNAPVRPAKGILKRSRSDNNLTRSTSFGMGLTATLGSEPGPRRSV